MEAVDAHTDRGGYGEFLGAVSCAIIPETLRTVGQAEL